MSKRSFTQATTVNEISLQLLHSFTLTSTLLKHSTTNKTHWHTNTCLLHYKQSIESRIDKTNCRPSHQLSRLKRHQRGHSPIIRFVVYKRSEVGTKIHRLPLGQRMRRWMKLVTYWPLHVCVSSCAGAGCLKTCSLQWS